MSRPQISIVTATFNALAGLRATTASVQAQTFRDFEHIVIDGGSIDGTKAWLSNQSHRINWLSEPDDGIGDAMNKGVSMARGDWVLVLQAEDTFFDCHSLQTAVGELETAADVVCFDVEFMAAPGSRLLVSKGFTMRLNFKPFHHQGTFTRRSLFDSVGPFDKALRFHMDYDFYLRAYRRGATSDTHRAVLTRMPATGITSKLDWQSLEARFAEEKLIHRRYSNRAWLDLMYSVYWLLYPRYRRLRSQLTGGATT